MTLLGHMHTSPASQNVGNADRLNQRDPRLPDVLRGLTGVQFP